MSDETKDEKILIVGSWARRVEINLDELRKSNGDNDIGPHALSLAIARALLAEIDRLSARVEELEHGVYPMEERIRSLEIEAAWKDGRL